MDRGPDSHGVIQFCIQKNIKGVCGNHDQSIINHWESFCKTGNYPKNKDKADTIKQINQQDVDYLKKLPKLHVFDDLGLILTHGGVWPGIPLYKQPENIIRCQMINIEDRQLFGKTKWFKQDIDGTREEDLLKLGWVKWFDAYDYPEDVIYGHSSWSQPKITISPNKNVGKCIGIDTGSSMGGSLTACIYSSDKTFYFVSIKNKEYYYKITDRNFWNE